MVGVRPHSTKADPGPKPVKRPRLQLDQRVPQDLEGPMQPSSDRLTSVVFLPSGSALQLHLDRFDLLLQPQPTSILQVSLPGHTLLLVPEGLQASTWPGHPEFSPTRPLGSALLDLPREHIVIEPGSISPSVRDSEVLESASPSGRPWMNAPAGLTPGLHLSSSFQGPVPDCWSPSDSPSAESYDPWSTRSLKGSMLEPLPGSTLQPPPPSPPSSAQEERPLNPVRPTRPPCKARRRLF
ncbi:proline rich 23 domain containing 1 [Rattus norvegicus]|uniref:Proline rich 23 domain containing 1 n=1 Tax=Rattus norvegicus TaxID=10116 RepID=A0A0G2K4G9_RAT|nr:proline rich 23 domain containing 1 [Rattus norvegicus]|eukprot:XP_001064056.1 PREDICTED: proline-rich protein 23A3-like [Rattus norvegicus]